MPITEPTEQHFHHAGARMAIGTTNRPDPTGEAAPEGKGDRPC